MSKQRAKGTAAERAVTDDIVTRLRDRLEESFCHCVDDPFFVCSYCAIEEAADEIERLRQEFNNAAAKANAYYELVEAYRWSHAHLGEWPDAISSLVAENYQLRKAVRGE